MFNICVYLRSSVDNLCSFAWGRVASGGQYFCILCGNDQNVYPPGVMKTRVLIKPVSWFEIGLV